MRVIDPHLHVWDVRLEERFPFARSRRPTARGDAPFLTELMDEAGVCGALIIQPIVYGFDHRYVTKTLRSDPARFRGMCLIDPSHADPPAELARWKEEGYTAVRFNPGLFESREAMGSEAGKRLFRAAGELEMPVGFLIGPDDFGAVDALCADSPDTRAAIDHFGHCRPTEEGRRDFERLLELSRHPNLYVKLSEWPRASLEPWPHRDLHPFVERLLEAYGRERLMWATDFPFIVEQCGYRRGLTLLTEETPGLDAETLSWLLSKTAESLFGAWGS